MSRFVRQVLKTVKQVDRPGAFCVAGVAPDVLPGLHVPGIGDIALPLSSQQAQELIQSSEQAAYGKGADTVVDTHVRNVRRLNPDKFTLDNPAWDRMIDQLAQQVAAELGLESQSLTPHLYDLLLYEPGGFFLPHRDGEKLKAMVATLVVTLPSVHEGGELVVRHEKQERILATGGQTSRFQTQYAAFYADCEHEVKPVTQGHRLCLVYNLTLKQSRKAIGAPRNASHVQALTRLLASWPKQDDAPRKIALTLEHEYTQDNLSWETLKGVDRARADVLAQAASAANGHAYLALLTLWQSGSAEDSEDGWHGGYGRDRDDEDDADDDPYEQGRYRMIEVCDSELMARDLRAVHQTQAAFDDMPIDESEIVPADAIGRVRPEEAFEGYTGNAGMSLERWYRVAAVVLWPGEHHVEVLCDAGVEQAVAELNRLTQTTGDATMPATVKNQQLAHRLARTLLKAWREDDSHDSYLDESPKPARNNPLPALERLDDPALIHLYLRHAMMNDPLLEPGDSFIPLMARHGMAEYEADLQKLMDRTAMGSLDRNAHLLEKLCEASQSQGSAADRRQAAKACWRWIEPVMATLLRLDDPAREDEGGYWHRRRVSQNLPDLLTCMVRSLLWAGDSAGLMALSSHAQSHEKRYSLQEVQLPMLLAVGKQAAVHASSLAWPAMRRWFTEAEKQFESLTERRPMPPVDHQRDAELSCRCADCAVLSRFLADPAAYEHRFQMAQARRSHLESIISTDACDVDCATDRKPRPQILICTKNTSTYQKRLKAYHENLKHLARLRETMPG